MCLLLVVSLCACGGEKDPKSALEKISENMQDLESLRFQLSMGMTMGVEGFELPIELSMTGESTMEPELFHGLLTLNMLGMNIDLETYMETKDGEIISYTGSDMGSGMEWEAGREEALPMEAMDLEVFLPLVSNFQKLEETGEVHGREVIYYGASLNPEAMKKMMESGAMGPVDEVLGENGDPFEGLPENFEIPITCGVDPEDLLICSLSMDLSQLFSQMDAEELGGTVEKVTVEMEFYDFNQVEPIEIPAEARAAANG